MDIFLQRFINREGEGIKYSDIPVETFLKYENVLRTDKDESDLVINLWKTHGLSSYRDGLFWTINPDEYSDLLHLFPNVSKTAIPFARTNLGNLFYFDKLSIGDSIFFLNVHKGTIKIVSTSFQILFAFDFGGESFWKQDCYGKIELKAIKKGKLAADECWAFVPALALGGDEKLSNLEKLKIKENLEFLGQLHQ